MSTNIPSMSLVLPKSSSVESYMQSAYHIPMLSAEREHTLATRLYSENDLPLFLDPGTKKRAGQKPIVGTSPKIINRNYYATGHAEYWPKLNYILKKTIFK